MGYSGYGQGVGMAGVGMPGVGMPGVGMPGVGMPGTGLPPGALTTLTGSVVEMAQPTMVTSVNPAMNSYNTYQPSMQGMPQV